MTVSVYGGSLLTELGSSEEVEYFFRCVNHFVEYQKKIQLPLVTDRLYRRYVSVENFDELRNNLSIIRNIFNEITISEVDLYGFNLKEFDINLNKSGNKLIYIFYSYFSSFERCMDTAERVHKKYTSYTPLLIGRDIIAPLFAMGIHDARDKKIRERYDTLEGNPLWWGA
ncbi:MAG: hypothetical protein ABF752_06160 [Acetobacter fabarum]|uniref:hypothetical protein n=1 Tax=Acetobacter fabarum TaxID=483199 RepID=UPI0039E8076A